MEANNYTYILLFLLILLLYNKNIKIRTKLESILTAGGSASMSRPGLPGLVTPAELMCTKRDVSRPSFPPVVSPARETA